MNRSAITIPVITVLIIALLWQLLSLYLDTIILPAPRAVFVRLLDEMSRESFWHHFIASSWRITAGMTLAFLLAVPLGLILGSSTRLDRLSAPLVYLGYPVPKIVFLPLILLIFGLGNLSKIVLIALIIFFQIFIPTRDAVRSIEPEVIYALQSLGGSRWDYYRHVVWPVALPGIFTALRIGTGTAVAVLFFVESISARHGIGFYLIDSWGRADYTAVFVGIIALAIMGIVLYECFDALEKRICRWKNV